MQHSTKLPTLNADKALAVLCKRSLYRFVQEFWSVIISEDPVWNWHIELLCDEMQEIIMRCAKTDFKPREAKLYDLAINIPPGSTKSTICTVMAPAWAWTVDQSLRILTASYSQSLSTDHAIKSRDIITSDKFKRLFPSIKIKIDQNNKTHYKNDKNGERYATSVGGTITGFHAHLIIVDDPLNAKQAASQVEIESANTFMDTTLSTRKVDKAVTVTALIMQRLNENDPTGNWLKKKNKKIRHICLPATLRDNITPITLRDRYVNGLLDPIRMSKETLAEMKIDLGSYGYAGQMEQDPAPEGGGIWKKWFIEIPDNEFPSKEMFDNYGNDWDTAYSDNELNAASGFIKSGKHKIDKRMYIDDFDLFYLEFPELIKKMKDVFGTHYIEAKASGKSAKQTLSRQGIAAIEVQVNGDKLARAKDASPFAEAGMVCIRKSLANRMYNDEEQGILKFPNGAKKDLADILAQSIVRHFGKPELKRAKSYY